MKEQEMMVRRWCEGKTWRKRGKLKKKGARDSKRTDADDWEMRFSKVDEDKMEWMK